MVLLFLGTSGSGKDTQAEILVRDYGFIVVSTGTVSREVIATGSELGKRAKEIIDSGKWLPDEMMYDLLAEYLQDKDISKVIFTGAVRRVSQVPLLDDLLQKRSSKLDKVIYFQLSDEEAIRRLSARWYCPKDSSTYDYHHKPPRVHGKCDLCGTELAQRSDDTPEGIIARLNEARVTTGPILDEYEKRGILVRIDASPGIEEVARKVSAVLSGKREEL